MNFRMLTGSFRNFEIKWLAVFLFCNAMIFSEGILAQEYNSVKNDKHMKIKILIDGEILNAELYDNATAKDLISRLPLEVELEDYANNEKIFYPKPQLSTEGAPEGYDPSAGDITYYAPWGDIAIFYKDFSYSKGLISVGKISDEDLKHLNFSGKKIARLELAKN